jgi:hypothetical protein
MKPLALKPRLSSGQFAERQSKQTLCISFRPDWQCARLAKGHSGGVAVRVRTTKAQQVAHARLAALAFICIPLARGRHTVQALPAAPASYPWRFGSRRCSGCGRSNRLDLALAIGTGRPEGRLRAPFFICPLCPAARRRRACRRRCR